MGLFRRARKNRDKPAVELPVEQTRVEVQVDAPRREVTAEARPDPDQPGWGRTLGQAIGKGREDPVRQE